MYDQLNDNLKEEAGQLRQLLQRAGLAKEAERAGGTRYGGEARVGVLRAKVSTIVLLFHRKLNSACQAFLAFTRVPPLAWPPWLGFQGQLGWTPHEPRRDWSGKVFFRGHGYGLGKFCAH